MPDKSLMFVAALAHARPSSSAGP